LYLELGSRAFPCIVTIEVSRHFSDNDIVTSLLPIISNVKEHNINFR